MNSAWINLVDYLANYLFPVFHGTSVIFGVWSHPQDINASEHFMYLQVFVPILTVVSNLSCAFICLRHQTPMRDLVFYHRKYCSSQPVGAKYQIVMFLGVIQADVTYIQCYMIFPVILLHIHYYVKYFLDLTSQYYHFGISLGLSPTKPKPSRALSSGPGLSFVKPKPGPAHHYWHCQQWFIHVLQHISFHPNLLPSRLLSLLQVE